MEVMKYLDYIIAIFTTLFAVAGMQFKNMKIIVDGEEIAWREN